MSWIWWKTINGKIAGPTAPPATLTYAMGIPVARLFLLPQKTIVISSSLLKPNARANQVVATNTMAKITQHTKVNIIKDCGGTVCHKPPITAALKAVYTTNKIELWSTLANQRRCLSTH